MAGCVTDSMDVSLSELRELVMDREAWRADSWGRKESDMTEQLSLLKTSLTPSLISTEDRTLRQQRTNLLAGRNVKKSIHLSKFHIYALVYYIGIFLSGLLHSV